MGLLRPPSQLPSVPANMLSALIQRVMPLKFTAGDLSAQLPVFLDTIHPKQFFSITVDQLPAALGLSFGLVIAIGLIFRLHCSEEASKGDGPDQSRSPLAGGSRSCGFLHAFLNRDGGGEVDLASAAAQFAEELQVEEEAAQSSSSIQKNSNSWWFSKSPKILCAICFETKSQHEIFRNPTCSHSFCIECTSGHISSKIQENIKVVRCPGCDAALDYNSCREIIPRDIIVKWDEYLCKSMIPESQIVYCPFSDCSAMLMKDEGEIIRRITCPACHRYICALRRVPYHSEFTCEKFKKLSGKKKKGREELMLKELVKKKGWRQCPQCKYYIEKIHGCLHITCRCKYEFCYRCGSKWSQTHGCYKASVWRWVLSLKNTFCDQLNQLLQVTKSSYMISLTLYKSNLGTNEG